MEQGGTVVQETRLFDPDRRQTRSMRSKEDAQDYRYFPDPDLPPLVIDEPWIARVKTEMPELPEAMRARFRRVYELPPADAAILTSTRELAEYFENTVEELGGSSKIASHWILGEVAAALNRDQADISAAKVSAKQLAALLKRVIDNTISGKIAKEVFDAMWAGEASGENAADAIIANKGLKQISDVGAVEKIVGAVIAANPAIVAEFRAGKEKAFNSLVGQVMKISKGKPNPAQVNEILRRKLGR